MIEVYNHTNSNIILPKESRFFVSNEFNNRIDRLLSYPINDSFLLGIKRTIKDLLIDMSKYMYVIIHGGVIRDTIHNIVNIKDIDILFNINNSKRIKNICNQLNLQCNIFDNYYKDIKFATIFYKDNKIYIDGLFKTSITSNSEENDVNCLLYNIKDKVIIDPIGTGFYNCLQKKFKICTNNFNDWFIYSNMFPLRIFKMFYKGYKLAKEQLLPLKCWYTQNFYKLYIENNKDLLNYYFLIKIRGDTNNKKGNNIELFYGIMYKIYEFDEEIYKYIINHLKLYDSILELYSCNSLL